MPESGLKIPISVPLFGKSSKLTTSFISITIGVLFENSLDLDTGRRPELKSDEFSKSTPIVIEIISILVEIERR